MNRRKKDNSIVILRMMILIMLLLIVIILLIYIPNLTNEKQLENELVKEGYETTEDNAFYNKIITNNTIDDYYNDVAAGKDSKYEEYYVSKESNNFIELKMINEKQMNSILNISSDLKTGTIIYNYELTYQDSHIILEGNSNDNYNCNVIVQKKASQDTIDYYCSQMAQEINSFITTQNELLQNNNISKRIK